MKINIVGKNVTITEAMHRQIEKKMERISNLFDSTDSLVATVLVSTCKNEQIVEISVNTGVINLRVKVKTEDMYSSLDLAIDRLEGQMRKVKTQMTNKKKHGALGKHIRFENIADYEDDLPVIVKKKNFTLVPMDQDEAMTRMEALNHSFFIYLDSTSGLINVLYRRDDGTYGLIEVKE